MDSSCFAITLNGVLARSRSNSPSTRGCGERMQTVNLVLARLVVTFVGVEGAVRVASWVRVEKTGRKGKGPV